MTAPLLNEMKFYVVIPAAATNLVTNPTPYRATTGYAVHDGGTGATIAASDTEQRRGPKSIAITPPAADEVAGIYFSTVSVTDTIVYTFSCDVKGIADQAMRIYITKAAGAALATTTFTATGYWQRIEVTLTAAETDATYRLYVDRDAVNSESLFYVDGFQFEVAAAATTFFSGDTKGFGIAPLEFYWSGTPHTSTSVRTADTRAGGSLLNLESYAIVSKAFGLGLGNFEQIYTNLASGGAYYQKHIRRPRNFSLLLDYYGDNAGELHDNRNAVIEAIRPDYTGYDQPLVIRYQGENTAGYEATNPIDIICIPQPSHADLPDNSRLQMNEVLNFTVLDSYLNGAYKEGLELGLYDTLTVGDYLVYRDKNGLWDDVDNAGTGVGVNPECLAEMPNGDIIVGGSFTNAGGIAEADYLAKWTGTAIEAVTAAADFNSRIEALAIDADGNLYIGGAFTDAGDANGDGIVKCTYPAGVLSSLGTGHIGVSDIAIEPNTGDIYAGGSFTEMGGVANTARIAYYDISASVWLPLSTGLADGTVYALVFAPNGNLYIGGTFTNADGSNGDYICYWDGTAFNMLGSTELSSSVYALAFDDNGRLYAGGVFTNAGDDDDADYIAMFENNAWHSVGSGGFDAAVWKILVHNNLVYAGGYFTTAGGLTLPDRVTVFNNGAWQPIDVNLADTDPIYDILISGDGNLFLGGNYTGTTIGCDQKTVTNNGNTKVYPTIEILGPGVLQSITNYTTGKGITFDGLTLQAGEIVTLDLDPIDINMTSTWVGRGDLERFVNPGSDKGQFHLKPGANYINFFMPSGTTAATKAYIYFTPKFWNIEGSRYE